MQVALDYYRILMVPLQEEEPQIEQAYRERTHLSRSQHPWASFSPQAWQARERLLDEAATVLLDPQRRQEYDSDLSIVHQGLDLDGDLLSGALMILCETGDFQGAQELAVTLLNRQQSASFTDAVLTVAIARLEMGREAWQKGAYEEAAEWLHSALVDLEAYRAFPEIQSEIQVDLGKLRPYRVLKLLGAEEDLAPERERGLLLLREMLDARGGIEGTSEDRSGLSTEDFLRFIQRVRHQMTIAEQESLFAQEADRPSLVGAYLAAQVLMVRGYVENRPALVRRSRSYLHRLAHHQDVHLEQAICSLLLGQTEEALAQLQLTREEDPLAFIKENSNSAPDQLPGLCRYTERWFSEEVFSEFRHLDVDEANLQAYFDNPQVQAYLEEMPASEEPEPTRWTVSMPNFARPTRPAVTPPEPVPSTHSDHPVYSDDVYSDREEQVSEPALNLAGSRYSEDRSMGSTSAGMGRHAGELSAAASYTDDGTPLLSTNSTPPPGEPGGRSANLSSPPSDYSDAGPYRRQDRTDSELTHPRLGRRRPPRPGSGFPFGPIAVLVALLASGLVIWRVLGFLFNNPAPDEQPQVDVTAPPVEIATATPDPSPAAPTPSPTPDVPAEWQGVTQVRVVSNTGINIRQQPTVQSPVVTGVASQAVLTVQDVEETTNPATPIWVQVEVNGSTGWAAAESGGTILLEKL